MNIDFKEPLEKYIGKFIHYSQFDDATDGDKNSADDFLVRVKRMPDGRVFFTSIVLSEDAEWSVFYISKESPVREVKPKGDEKARIIRLLFREKAPWL
jgi:hypothetical protein